MTVDDVHACTGERRTGSIGDDAGNRPRGRLSPGGSDCWHDEKKSEQQFIDGYKAAHTTIYKRHDYAKAIDMLKALGHDDNPDVANLIGYSSRKLGRYEDSKIWYERALAADPTHSRTWSYYGMWHAEQGNLLKAREHLAKVASLCGTKCRDYTELKGVIEGTRTY